MAWNKEYILITLRNASTGSLDTTLHTVEVQPTTSVYPAGAVNCTQLPNLSTYKPDSNLDEDTHYWVYVDTVKVYKLTALNSEPALGA